jgi:hypothetical protein
MANLTVDTELQTELQEVYIEATHWLQDISFMETETAFFRNVINRYQISIAIISRQEEFKAKIVDQERKLAELGAKIPDFLVFLKPYIENSKKKLNLDFLNRYNFLKSELDTLFSSLRTTRNELFHYTESIMPQPKLTLS